MPDIDDQDDWIKRLGKLVPVYVVALTTATVPILQYMYEEEPDQARLMVVVLLIIGAIVAFGVEYMYKNVKNIAQLGVAVLNSILWVVVINIRFLDLTTVETLWLQFITAVWTFLVGLLAKPQLWEKFPKLP